jgi:2-C-methyl-D-erythritol 4-phosphate cytidylyltransferase
MCNSYLSADPVSRAWSPHPRQFVPEERERLWKFSRNNFIVFAFAAVIIVLLTRFTKWVLMH